MNVAVLIKHSYGELAKLRPLSERAPLNATPESLRPRGQPVELTSLIFQTV